MDDLPKLGNLLASSRLYKMQPQAVELFFLKKSNALTVRTPVFKSFSAEDFSKFGHQTIPLVVHKGRRYQSKDSFMRTSIGCEKVYRPKRLDRRILASCAQCEICFPIFTTLAPTQQTLNVVEAFETGTVLSPMDWLLARHSALGVILEKCYAPEMEQIRLQIKVSADALAYANKSSRKRLMTGVRHGFLKDWKHILDNLENSLKYNEKSVQIEPKIFLLFESLPKLIQETLAFNQFSATSTGGLRMTVTDAQLNLLLTAR